jgi:hypothetical protein
MAKQRFAAFNADGTRMSHPCSPKRQIYEGEPGTMLVCSECQQTMAGILYPYGIGLLTLPIHHNPLWANHSFRMLSPGRVLRRRSISV